MDHSEADLRPTERFSSRVEDYAKYRPSYPPQVMGLLEAEAGLSPDSSVADVGSGTGIFSDLLLRQGTTVFAVEPNAPMRHAAESLLASRTKFHSIDGTAESTGLPDASVDGVTVAQAFHWFDHRRAAGEFARITRRGGFVALIWNARVVERSAFMQAYDRIVKTFGSDFVRLDRELVPFDTLAALFGPSMRLHVFPNDQQLDWPGLKGRLLSASYMPLPGRPGFDPMLTELREAFDLHQTGGRVRIEYDTRVYLARP